MTNSQFNQIMNKIDGVETKIDDVKSELKADIKAVDVKVDKLSGRIDNLVKKNDLEE